MEVVPVPYTLTRECNEFDSKIKAIRLNIGLITSSTFDIISNKILEIQILNNIKERSDAVDFIPEEIDKMNIVVQVFIDSIKLFNVSGNMEIPNVIASLFVKLRDKWEGHQGRVLSSVMVNYIGKYLKNYCENSDELSLVDKMKCPQIIYFTGLLYNRGMFQTKYCMGILVKFMNKDEQSITVFCNLLTVCFDKFTSESEIDMFNKKKGDFKSFVLSVSISSFTTFCLDKTTFDIPAVPCQHPSRLANLGFGILYLTPAASSFVFHSFFIRIHSPLTDCHKLVIAIWQSLLTLTCSSLP
jgi:hypothetical protein